MTARSDQRGEGRTDTPPNDYDRRLRSAQQPLLHRRELSQLPCRGKIRHHHGKRLFITLLELAQPGNGLVVRCINSQMETAQSLDRYDLALLQQVCRPCQRLRMLRQQRQLWTAGWTGDRLGMKTPVARILILRLTRWTERKPGHGGKGAVVGNAGHDGPAGTAVGAGDEGVPVAAISWIKQLTQAIGAQGRVRRDLRLPLAVAAGKDHKTGLLDLFRKLMLFKL